MSIHAGAPGTSPTGSVIGFAGRTNGASPDGARTGTGHAARSAEGLQASGVDAAMLGLAPDGPGLVSAPVPGERLAPRSHAAMETARTMAAPSATTVVASRSVGLPLRFVAGNHRVVT